LVSTNSVVFAGFVEKEIKKANIPIMDTGENPEVPFPRDMIDLEVMACVQTRVVFGCRWKRGKGAPLVDTRGISWQRCVNRSPWLAPDTLALPAHSGWVLTHKRCFACAFVQMQLDVKALERNST